MINPSLPMDEVYESAKLLGNFENETEALGVLAASIWMYLSMTDFETNSINPHLLSLASSLVALEQSEIIDLEEYDNWKHALVSTFEMFEQKYIDINMRTAPSDMDNPLPE